MTALKGITPLRVFLLVLNKIEKGRAGIVLVVKPSALRRVLIIYSF